MFSLQSFPAMKRQSNEHYYFIQVDFLRVMLTYSAHESIAVQWKQGKMTCATYPNLCRHEMDKHKSDPSFLVSCFVSWRFLGKGLFLKSATFIRNDRVSNI